MIKIAVVDDHKLFVKSLSMLLATFDGFSVVMEAGNGKELQQMLPATTDQPDIVLLDVNMQEMDGPATAKWLNEQYPLVKIVALTTDNDELTVIDMIHSGCCAYLLKDTHPNELEKALLEIHKKGYYNGDAGNINFRRLLLAQEERHKLQLSDKEKEFIQLACSDMTYKQVASIMKVSERSVDAYRESLFEKFHVQSRVGLCLEVVRRGLVQLRK